MSNQCNAFQLLKRHYEDIREHKVTKNYINFHEKVPVSITHIENIKVTKYYSITNGLLYPSHLVDCNNRYILDVANTVFSSSDATTVLDPSRKTSKHIYVGQANSPSGVAGRFSSHTSFKCECMPRDL